MGNLNLQLLLLFLMCLSCINSSSSFSWPFSSSKTPPQSNDAPRYALEGKISGFSMESLESDPKGVKLVENARRKLVSSNSCWQNAYRNLFGSCSEIISDKEKQSRLAWHLSDCFQRDSGRSPLPTCDANSPMIKCLERLDEHVHKIYLEFFLETNSICHQLQTIAFKHQTERLVNDLAKSAQFAEDKLQIIEGRSEELIQDSNKIHDSLTSIDLQAQQLAQVSKNVEDHINDVLKHSEAIFDQAKGIAASQLELQKGQVDMKLKLESGMTFLRESYESLDDGMEKLKNEAIDIEREIKEVGTSMSSKMQDLQSTANDIGNVAGVSLEKQKQLLDGQAVALEGLDFLSKFQSQALQESRDALQKLAEFGRKQQEELLQRQDLIQQTHDRLIQNSQSILAAQEEFELRQANIFSALDKLFALHNALLAESRFIKSFFFYACLIFLLYLLTSTKQTFGIRARLYLGLCVTFALELAILKLKEKDLDQQAWISSQIFLARSSFLVVASIQILYSIFTFRDYDMLNHHLLQRLMEKVDIMEHNTGKNLLSLSMDSDLSKYSWIEEELPEDVDINADPDYALPEEVAENSITTSFTRKYDLRPRRRY